MANQFYYQIVDNTLYYGANEWEGAKLLSENTNINRPLFDLYNLAFTSIRPKDETIVEVHIKKDNILFSMNYNRVYDILDLTHFSIISNGFNL